MSGGLSHHADEGNGPSHTVGHELSKQQGCYSLERNQCVCADVIRVPANYKNKPAPLDMTDVVRDVEILLLSCPLSQIVEHIVPGRERLIHHHEREPNVR